MTEYLRGGSGKMRFERDDGYRDESDVKDLFAPFREWRADAERKAIRWARGRVLDVGCGPGRVALYLQRRGLAVVGIDAVPEVVEIARRRGVRDVQLMDANRLDFPRRSFDTFVMFGNNFGICGSVAATKRFLRRAHEIGRPHARLLGSSNIPGSWMDRHAEYIKRNVRAGRPPGLIRIRIARGREKGDWFHLLLVSPDDLLRLCEATGWDVRKIFLDSKGRSSYAFVAERM